MRNGCASATPPGPSRTLHEAGMWVASSPPSQRAIRTSVPAGPLAIAKSSISRRAPGSPKPSEPPVETPSRSAASTSAIPGPASRTVTARPRRPDRSTGTSSTSPPPAYLTALRATSETAVATCWASTPESPHRSASSRAARAADATSASPATRTARCGLIPPAGSARRRRARRRTPCRARARIRSAMSCAEPPDAIALREAGVDPVGREHHHVAVVEVGARDLDRGQVVADDAALGQRALGRRARAGARVHQAPLDVADAGPAHAPVDEVEPGERHHRAAGPRERARGTPRSAAPAPRRGARLITAAAASAASAASAPCPSPSIAATSAPPS